MEPPPIRLRAWRDDDLAPFAEMNADPRVMEFFPKLLSFEESRESYLRLRTGLEQRGWGLWVVEAEGAFAGFTGLAEPRFTAAFTPCVEMGWRLRSECWGRGIAFAAAQQAEAFAFDRLRLAELVSFTATGNLRSRRLMERLGFTHRPDEDFDHPAIAVNHPVRRHVLYRKARSDYRGATPVG